ncbi:10824_t:CDS:2 [Dentiscutata erythropus]|uniref:10824_t:CDS:1 n=1 Tax=Dentiscutata erythropus TaxID=1348616 RepID=A0A9N9D7H2_9GLOM|nr:10824_t:CDS:2 [Dentiscutata erythropus]
MIGYFGQFGIGTDVNYQLAISSYIYASKSILNISNNDNDDLSLFNNLVKNNRLLGQISLAYLYFSGIVVEENISYSQLKC